MHRLCLALMALVLAVASAGCDGQSQPNAAAKPEELNADFSKKTADMMKAANTGMDPKAAKTGGAGRSRQVNRTGLAQRPSPAPRMDEGECQVVKFPGETGR